MAEFYRVSRAWRVAQNGALLIVSGGADAIYEVPLNSSEESVYASVAQSAKFRRSDLQPVDADVFEQLLTARVVEIIGRKRKVLRVTLLGDKLPLNFGSSVKIVNDVAEADIAVIIRTTSTHAGIIKGIDYYTLDVPHIYVDAAYHHVVSVGPLVFPGETACIGCLFGRIRERWGDDRPAPTPAVIGYDITEGLVSSELQRYSAGDTSLVGQVVAWDIAGRSIVTDTLLKSSACPRCGDTSQNISISGRIGG